MKLKQIGVGAGTIEHYPAVCLVNAVYEQPVRLNMDYGRECFVKLYTLLQHICCSFKLFLSVFFFLPAVFCTAAPEPPDWVVRGLAAVYPAETYIAQEGRGKTRAAAEADALAAVSRYFTAEVSSSVFAAESLRDGEYRARLETETSVQSASRLFAVRYAEPWRDPKSRDYRSAAYINRNEAWAIFEPRVKKEADAFRALDRKAESETVPLRAFFDYRAVRHYTNREAFKTTMAFGEVLHPVKMETLVRDVREAASRLNARIAEARSMAGIFIHCPRDFESKLASALTRLLSSEGLFIANTRNAASAVCTVTVDEGYQQGDGHFYYPQVNVVIAAKNGVPIFSWSASPGKQAALSADAAKRRAYTALAGELEKNFLTELGKNFE